ncbi:mevalonate kinase [Methanobacterium petrolearium]|uniref:mevalonate kinase n=1 Tax=Methanobacterium petrolearium TaxID=710190 RepID=UPI001AE495DF|nr:mevalonate kinase [Methanobacterium petrolearium]MBP1945508.1 mevalonate kinase [Methanobacterium petrolearium]BDZ71719.1 mevalonate kinase [Methanobacterium petrolearium]
MKVSASAPGKTILFGEHAVVYGKPAIAVAVDRRAKVTIQEGTDNNITVKIPELDVYGAIDIDNQQISHLNQDGVFDLSKDLQNNVDLSKDLQDNLDLSKNHDNTSDPSNNPLKPSSYDAGILKYIQKALFNFAPDHGLDVHVDLEIPIGGGLGSSAAVTVATLAAAARYNHQEITRETLAKMAHQAELEVQGAASPLDTTVSTYGGFIYFTHNRGAEKMKPAMKMPLVVGYTKNPGNTGLLVAGVRKLHDKHPQIVKPILDTMENLTNQAKQAILQGEEKQIGELMNINQGFLDALGVNTLELSNLIYHARNAGATGSKITGAGGGGSIIAYCPGKTDEVLKELKSFDKAFQVDISSEGVTFQ